MNFDLTTWLLIIGIPVLIGVGFFLYKRSHTTREEPYHHFRCPGCRRKLRYQARQVGHKAMCNHCKEEFVFPPPLGD